MRLPLEMLTLLWTAIIHIGTVNSQAIGPLLRGKTPCCFDWLGGLLCMRQKNSNLAAFLHKCMRNADFAFVQCCRTCFGQSAQDPFRLSYAKTAESLLTSPESANCVDRRGSAWCEWFSGDKKSMLHQLSGDWGRRRVPMDCKNVPISFRLCRRSCGFCGTKEVPAQVLYDEAIATSRRQCHNPARGLATRLPSENSVYRDFINRFNLFNQKARKRKRLQRKGEERSVSSGEEGTYLIRPLFWIKE